MSKITAGANIANMTVQAQTAKHGVLAEQAIIIAYMTQSGAS